MIRTRWRFGSKRRLVATIDRERWFPNPGFLPQITQTLLISAASLRSYRFPIRVRYRTFRHRIYRIERFDVKVYGFDNPRMASDDVDRLLEDIDAAGVPIDLEVEAIVGRVGAVKRRLYTLLRETLSEHAFTPEDWHVLTTLRLRRAPYVAAGALARDLEISAAAMTSRLGRLEQAGFIKRNLDPGNRRTVQVVLTPKGRRAWDEAVQVQSQKEALVTDALTPSERKTLNKLLRKLMVALEDYR
jgi:DNA-binding MarR family transcriptional regulator